MKASSSKAVSSLFALFFESLKRESVFNVSIEDNYKENRLDDFSHS